MQPRPRFPGLDGAIAVAVAIGLTELLAGLSAAVPSAIASVGSVVVDYSPPVVKDIAIGTLGTADKGALAIGTVVVAVLIGVVIGRLSVKRFWIAIAAFGLFALLGVGVQLDQPGAEPLYVLVATPFAALAGLGTLRLLYRLDASARLEDPTDGRVGDNSKRRFIAVATGAGVGAAAAMAVGRAQIIRRSEADRLATGLPTSDNPLAAPETAHDFQLEGLTPIIQHEPDFYRIDTALIVPIVDTDSWTLRVHGLVEEEVVFSFDDIAGMEQHDRFVTLSCVSNEVGGDLVGNARWQGVMLTDLLDMARPLDTAGQIVPRSVDGWAAGFPIEAAYDGREPIVAVGMNGVPLPRKHGYPARLVVPGLYGYVSATKWLSEIELTTWDGFDSYWVPRGWAKEGPIKTQSRIDRPRNGQTVSEGVYTVAGVAWAPNRGIARVEVQLDEGEWQEAELSDPLSDDAWVQWKVDVDFPVGAHRLRVRATDGTGDTQPEQPMPPRPDGATGWHVIAVGTAEA